MTKNYADQIHKKESNKFETHLLKDNEITQMNEPEAITAPQSTKSARRTKDDIRNILLIFSLYFLQGLPIGLMTSMPLILSSRGVSYKDQGTLSFAFWPYALKILWAPFVDSFYIEKIGRRKSWIVAVELLLGIVSFSSGDYLNKILSVEFTRTSQNIIMLTLIFVLISFLNSTHDIIMDGWAIDLLLKENVSWQATCNSVGFVCGNFIGNAFFILLESAEFCNQYFRPILNLSAQPYGFLDIKTFLYIYGSLMVFSAFFILIFKSEKNPKKLNEELEKRSVAGTYMLIWKLVCKPEIRKLIFILLTIRIGFATEMIIRLRLIEEGVEKEKITILGIMLSPVMILLPIVLSKYLHGPRPLNLVLDTYGPKLIIVLFFTFFIVLTPYLKNDVDNSLPLYYYGIYFILNVFSASCSFIFYVSVGSFNSQISDKSIGGTYLTFMSLWLSIGSAFTRTSVLYLTNIFTFKYCFLNTELFQLDSNDTLSIKSLDNSTINLAKLYANKCSSESLTKSCVADGGTCHKYFDGFYLLSFVMITIGFIWLIFCRKLVTKLQSLPKSVFTLSDQVKSNAKFTGIEAS